MSISTKQLGMLLVLLVAITLTLAWIIERRQILSFREELDAWGHGDIAVAPPAPAASVPVQPPPPVVPDPDAPVPFVPPPVEASELDGE